MLMFHSKRCDAGFVIQIKPALLFLDSHHSVIFHVFKQYYLKPAIRIYRCSYNDLWQ